MLKAKIKPMFDSFVYRPPNKKSIPSLEKLIIWFTTFVNPFKASCPHEVSNTMNAKTIVLPVPQGQS